MNEDFFFFFLLLAGTYKLSIFYGSTWFLRPSRSLSLVCTVVTLMVMRYRFYRCTLMRMLMISIPVGQRSC